MFLLLMFYPIHSELLLKRGLEISNYNIRKASFICSCEAKLSGLHSRSQPWCEGEITVWSFIPWSLLQEYSEVPLALRARASFVADLEGVSRRKRRKILSYC